MVPGAGAKKPNRMNEHGNNDPQRALTGGLRATSLWMALCLGASVSLCACFPRTLSQAQQIDRRLAELAPSDRTFKADAVLNDQHAGQWSQYKYVDENGEPSILTYKLVASDGFLHSLEIVEEDYYGKFATYLETRYDPGRPSQNLEVKRVLTRDGEALPKESSPEDLEVKASYYRALATQLFVHWAAAPKDGDIRVGGGQFRDSQKSEAILTVGGLSFRARTWHHPVLPMHGLVKAERSDGTAGSIELLGFGLDGARSEVLRAVR